MKLHIVSKNVDASLHSGTSQILRQVVLPRLRDREWATCDERHVGIGAADQHQGRKKRENEVFIHGASFLLKSSCDGTDCKADAPFGQAIKR